MLTRHTFHTHFSFCQQIAMMGFNILCQREHCWLVESALTVWPQCVRAYFMSSLIITETQELFKLQLPFTSRTTINRTAVDFYANTFFQRVTNLQCQWWHRVYVCLFVKTADIPHRLDLVSSSSRPWYTTSTTCHLTDLLMLSSLILCTSDATNVPASFTSQLMTVDHINAVRSHCHCSPQLMVYIASIASLRTCIFLHLICKLSNSEHAYSYTSSVTCPTLKVA